MVLAYRDADAGPFDLDERYALRSEDMRRRSGLLQTFALGLQPTYRDLVTQMIVTSDNTATDILIARLGLARVNRMLADLNYTETRLQTTTGELFRRLLALADPANEDLSPTEVYTRDFPTDTDALSRAATRKVECLAGEREPRLLVVGHDSQTLLHGRALAGVERCSSMDSIRLVAGSKGTTRCRFSGSSYGSYSALPTGLLPSYTSSISGSSH
jgi:Beta-lactamase enzyme family